MNSLQLVKRIASTTTKNTSSFKGLVGMTSTMRSFSTTAPTNDWENIPKFSIEDFLANKDNFQIDDSVISAYIKKASKLSLIKFQSCRQLLIDVLW